MQIKKHLPNLITLLNLTSGLIALVYIFNDNITMAFLWVCLGILFDFFDGFAARLLKVASPLGLQLDSLADMITSGVVPGLAMYKMLANIQENHDIYNLTPETYYMGIVPYFGFIITLGAALRLAKFNIDTRQTDSFIGLPTPGNALFILSIPMIALSTANENVRTLTENPYVLVFISLLSAYLMNAEIPLFSLKVKKIDFKSNVKTILFIGLSVILILLLNYQAVPIIIFTYILLSIFLNKNKKASI